MSFDPNIPTTSDSTLQSFQQLRANFQAINNAFSENHIGLTQNQIYAGMHDNMIFEPTTDPATSATQVAIYNKLVSTIPELFFRPSSSQTPIQLTYPSIKADSTSTQYTFMAGPFVIYGGLIKTPTQSQVVTLTPVTTLIFVDLIATNYTNIPSAKAIINPIPIAIAANQFTIHLVPQSTIGQYDTFYFAIGV